MDKIRIAMVGLGEIANYHLDALAEFEEAELVAVCDLREDRILKVADQHDCRAYGDHRQMLGESACDLIFVLTPPGSHCHIVEAAAASGAHIFCEKPLALNIDEAQRMIRACKRNGVSLFYGSSFRYLPTIRKAKELIDEGAIGEVALLQEHRIGGRGKEGYAPLDESHYPPGGPGGWAMGLMDHGIHLADIFSWMTGQSVRRVEGQGQISGEPPVTEYLTITFDNGAIGNLIYNGATYGNSLPGEGMFSNGTGWGATGEPIQPGHWDPDPATISIYGSKGALRIAYYAGKLFLNDEKGRRAIPVDGLTGNHFLPQMEACLTAIRENRAPDVGGGEALDALELVLTAFDRDSRRCDGKDIRQ